jgi:hypothetical protein
MSLILMFIHQCKGDQHPSAAAAAVAAAAATQPKETNIRKCSLQML